MILVSILDRVFRRDDYSHSSLLSRVKAREQNTKWSFLKKGYVEEKDTVVVGNDEILLGASDRDYMDAVTIPYSRKKRITIVVVGGQGSGKTVLARSLVFDNFVNRFHHPVWFGDPKLDGHFLTEPNTNPAQIELLIRYGYRPRAYDIYFAVPEFMDMYGARGKEDGHEITLSMENFLNMDKDSAIAAISNVLSVKDDEPAFMIISQVMLSGNPPRTIEEFWSRVQQIMSETGIKSSRLEQKWDNLVKTKKISNRYFNYAEKMMAHDAVVLEGTVADEDSSEKMVQGIFINSAAHEIIAARTKAIRDPQHGVLKKIPILYLDEANTYAGKGKISASVISSLSSKYRSINNMAGISSVVVSQFLHTLASEIVNQADIILTPKIVDDRDLQILKDRGSDVYVFDEMHYDINNRPNEFVAFGMGGYNDYKKFFSLPTCSQMSTA